MHWKFHQLDLKGAQTFLKILLILQLKKLASSIINRLTEADEASQLMR